MKSSSLVALPLHSDSAAGLGTIFGQRGPLDVAKVGDRDDHILVGIEVLRVEFLGRRTDLGPSRVGVFVLEFDGLSLDDASSAPRRFRESRCSGR